MRNVGGLLADVVRMEVGKWPKGKKFSRSELRARLEQLGSKRVLAAIKAGNLAITLIDMLNRGELKRSGIGDAAIYQADHLHAPGQRPGRKKIQADSRIEVAENYKKFRDENPTRQIATPED